MQKFFVENRQIENGKIILEGRDVNHIINVLRMKKKDEIQIGNKETLDTYIVEIEEIYTDKIIANIVEKLDIRNEPNIQIDL